MPFALCGNDILARWGVVEWIEHPLLMLEVRGSNPGHSISKNTTSLPETKWLFGARCVASFPELGVTPGSDQKKLQQDIFWFDPAPFTQFRYPGVRPAPRGASRASG